MSTLFKLVFTAVAGLGAMGAVLAPAPSAHAALVEIAVSGVAHARGHVRVQLCTRTTFLTKTCPYRGEAVATIGGATVVRIDQVAPGQYAVQAFHDETDQGVVHQNLLGVPREKIGFSKDAPITLRGPRFDDAAFPVAGSQEVVSLTLRSLFGR